MVSWPLFSGRSPRRGFRFPVFWPFCCLRFFARVPEPPPSVQAKDDGEHFIVMADREDGYFSEQVFWNFLKILEFCRGMITLRSA